MSTTITEAPAAFTLSRSERDAIWEHLQYMLDGDAPGGTETEIRDHQWEVDVYVKFCEALGWQHEDNRESYGLPTVQPSEMRARVQRWAKSAVRCVHDAVAHIDHDVARDPKYIEGTTAGTGLRAAAEAASADLLNAAVLMDLLDRLNAEDAA